MIRAPRAHARVRQRPRQGPRARRAAGRHRDLRGRRCPRSARTTWQTELLKAYAGTPQGRLPDLDTAFANVARADPSQAGELETIQEEVESIIERAATSSFQRPLRYSALFALLVVPVLAIRFFYNTRRRLTPQLQ